MFALSALSFLLACSAGVHAVDVTSSSTSTSSTSSTSTSSSSSSASPSSTSASAASGDRCAGFIVVDKSAITISDDASSGFSVKLNAAPVEDTHVFLDAQGLKFSACSLTFTKDNYNTPQAVTVYPEGNLFNSVGLQSNFSVKVSTKINCADATACSVVIPATRKYTAVGGTCTVWGDPHFTTYSGLSYAFMGINSTFYALKSDELDIQVRHGLYANTAGTTYGIAVRYGNEFIRFDNNGTALTLAASTANSDITKFVNMNVTRTDTGGGTPSYKIETNKGNIQLNIFCRMPAGFNPFYDYTLMVPAGTISANHGGLCGKLGDAVNTLTDATGKVTPIDPALAISTSPASDTVAMTWAVANEDSIFLGNLKGRDLKDNVVRSTCSLTPDYDHCKAVVIPEQPKVVVIGTTLDDFGKVTNYGQVVSMNTSCTLKHDDAVRYCTDIFNDANCPLITVNMKELSCALDVLSGCQMRFADDARVSYHTNCALYAQRVKSTYDADNTVADKTERDNHYQDNAVYCNNRGFDTPYGCHCSPGFGGSQCQYAASDYRGSDNPCSKRGNLYNGRCVCDTGYKGADCSQDDPICSGNGIYDRDGMCKCYSGFKGYNCGDKDAGYKANTKAPCPLPPATTTTVAPCDQKTSAPIASPKPAGYGSGEDKSKLAITSGSYIVTISSGIFVVSVSVLALLI